MRLDQLERFVLRQRDDGAALANGLMDPADGCFKHNGFYDEGRAPSTGWRYDFAMVEDRSFDAAVAAWLTHLRDVLARSPHTVRAYGGDLALLRAALVAANHRGLTDVDAIDVDFVEESLAQHSESGASETRRRVAYRGFFDFCEKTSRVSRSMAPDIEVPELDRQVTRVAPAAEATKASRAALKAAEQTTRADDDDLRRRAIALRDGAVIELLSAAGLRISELVALSTLDVERHFVSVAGTGKRRRVVTVGDGCAEALRQWLVAGRPLLVTAKSGDALFLGARGKRVIDSELRRRIALHGAAAGSSERLHPAKLRHGYAAQRIQDGTDLKDVQQELGMARAETARRYFDIELPKPRA